MRKDWMKKNENRLDLFLHFNSVRQSVEVFILSHCNLLVIDWIVVLIFLSHLLHERAEGKVSRSFIKNWFRMNFRWCNRDNGNKLFILSRNCRLVIADQFDAPLIFLLLLLLLLFSFWFGSVSPDLLRLVNVDDVANVDVQLVVGIFEKRSCLRKKKNYSIWFGGFGGNRITKLVLHINW